MQRTKSSACRSERASFILLRGSFSAQRPLLRSSSGGSFDHSTDNSSSGSYEFLAISPHKRGNSGSSRRPDLFLSGWILHSFDNHT